MRPEPADEGRWDVWHDHGAQWKGKQKRGELRARRGVNLSIWQQGVMASKKLHFRAVSKPEVCLLIRSLSLRCSLDLVDSPWLCPCVPALPEIPATSCSLRGRGRKNALGALAISSC